MTLKVVPAVLGAGAHTYTWTVPGNEKWSIRTACATVARAIGGIPNRSYLVELGASGFVLAAVGAPDAGTEPGACQVTFADAPSAQSAVGPFGVVVAPLNLATVPPGYTVTFSIVGAVAGDAIGSAVIWVDYVPASG